MLRSSSGQHGERERAKRQRSHDAPEGERTDRPALSPVGPSTGSARLVPRPELIMMLRRHPLPDKGRWIVIALSSARRILALAAATLLLGCGGVDDGDRGRAGGAPADTVGEVAADAAADSSPPAVVSGVVYVPDYSHIYHGSERNRYPLTTTLSVRNTDPDRSITVTSVRYYNTEGELDRRFLEKPRRLGPLGTAEFVVAEHEITGGSGANFIVEWSADRPVSEPMIESVMISTRSGQGLSFTSRGHPIVRPPE